MLRCHLLLVWRWTFQLTTEAGIVTTQSWNRMGLDQLLADIVRWWKKQVVEKAVLFELLVRVRNLVRSIHCHCAALVGGWDWTVLVFFWLTKASVFFQASLIDPWEQNFSSQMKFQEFLDISIYIFLVSCVGSRPDSAVVRVRPVQWRLPRNSTRLDWRLLCRFFGGQGEKSGRAYRPVGMWLFQSKACFCRKWPNGKFERSEVSGCERHAHPTWRIGEICVSLP